MAGRHQSVGQARGLRLLGVLVLATVVAAALVLADRSGHRSAVGPAHPSTTNTADAPYKIGDRVLCPLGQPVLATSNQASYPPGHPGHPPPGVRPVACYPSVAQATAAGYPPAPLPAGAVELGGVYLTPTSQAFRTRCQHAADQLGFAVLCPELLPTAASGTTPPQLCQGRTSCSGEQVFIVNDGGFLVPPGYLGVEKQSQGHLVVMATPRRPNDPRPPTIGWAAMPTTPSPGRRSTAPKPCCCAVPPAPRSTAATPWCAGPREGSTWPSACMAGAS